MVVLGLEMEDGAPLIRQETWGKQLRERVEVLTDTGNRSRVNDKHKLGVMWWRRGRVGAVGGVFVQDTTTVNEGERSWGFAGSSRSL